MKREPEALVVGKQVGSSAPGLYEEGKVYLHVVERVGKLWQEVAAGTGSEWRVDATLVEDPRPNKPWADEGIKKLNLVITRTG